MNSRGWIAMASTKPAIPPAYVSTVGDALDDMLGFATKTPDRCILPLYMIKQMMNSCYIYEI